MTKRLLMADPVANPRLSRATMRLAAVCMAGPPSEDTICGADIMQMFPRYPFERENNHMRMM